MGYYSWEGVAAGEVAGRGLTGKTIPILPRPKMVGALGALSRPEIGLH